MLRRAPPTHRTRYPTNWTGFTWDTHWTRAPNMSGTLRWLPSMPMTFDNPDEEQDHERDKRQDVPEAPSEPKA